MNAVVRRLANRELVPRFICVTTHHLLDDLRAIAATIISALSAYLVFDLFANGFSWVVLAGGLFGFVLAHFLWPKTDNGNDHWYDSLELFVELPYRAVALALRMLGSVLSRSD